MDARGGVKTCRMRVPSLNFDAARRGHEGERENSQTKQHKSNYSVLEIKKGDSEDLKYRTLTNKTNGLLKGEKKE